MRLLVALLLVVSLPVGVVLAQTDTPVPPTATPTPYPSATPYPTVVPGGTPPPDLVYTVPVLWGGWMWVFYLVSAIFVIYSVYRVVLGLIPTS